MAGITGYGGYVPLHRLGPATRGWSSKTERAVANFDEDSITMSLAAVRDLLRGEDRDGIDALYLASTSLPYEEKQAAATVATAADLRRQIFTTDVGQTLRAGTVALTMALDAVKAGRVASALVAAADSRTGMPGSDLEKVLGDGAAALSVGEGDEIASVEASASVVNEIYDIWRPSGEQILRNWEERFVQEEGYLDAIMAATAELEKQTGRAVTDYDRVVLYGLDARRHAEAARLLKLDKPRLQDPLFDTLGNTGAAFAIMQLVACLQNAGPGESILVVNYGNGADALALRTTDRLPAYQQTQRRGVLGYLNSKLELEDYGDYLKWRGLLAADTGARRPSTSGPSAAALHREQEEVLQFHGVRCLKCSTIQYPPQRICISCKSKDDFETVRLADEPATIFTFSLDYIAGTMDIPLALTVIDFGIGGRAVVMMTDRRVEDVQIGEPVELSLRLSRSGAGIRSYYWKAVPLREKFAEAAPRAEPALAAS
jgi:3-hydroxy-3-methylglutaryl CoA synthase